MGKDKALLELEGQTLLQRAIHFCQSFCGEILISSKSLKHKVDGIQIVSDEINDCGPIGGIYSCLKKSKNDWNFVISVDAPFVEIDFVSFLVAQKEDFDAVVPVHKSGREPLIALYNKNAIDDFKLQIESGNFKMYFLLQQIKTNFVSVDDWLDKYSDLFRNLNFPEDLNSVF
ncbi:molybdenum cofactor guanylyltransferase [Maribellus maritimus]|nr:molybdenum cofactor guanylyltransferase [Maribellus maritimus]